MRLAPFVFVCGVACLAQPSAPARPDLKVGDPAPEFKLPSTAGGDFALSDFRGKKPVVLAFFIKAFSAGCTREMQGYEAAIRKFEEGGNQVIGIGTDDLDTLKRWAAELKLTFPLLSDADGKAAAAYGVLMDTHKLAYRTTFLIDRDGKIQYLERGGSAIDPAGAVAACSRH